MWGRFADAVGLLVTETLRNIARPLHLFAISHNEQTLSLIDGAEIILSLLEIFRSKPNSAKGSLGTLILLNHSVLHTRNDKLRIPSA